MFFRFWRFKKQTIISPTKLKSNLSGKREIHRPWMEILEDRCVLSGTSVVDMKSLLSPYILSNSIKYVTVVTHGFQLTDGNGDALYDLAKDIRNNADNLDGDKTSWLIDFELEDDSSFFDSTTVNNGSIIPKSGSPDHIVLLYDWARMSNEASTGWGEAAGDGLFSLLVGTGLVDPSLGAANPTLHFISHSFGTPVTSECIERLASYSVPVAQATFLDPHDFTQYFPVESDQKLWSLGKPSSDDELLGYGVSVWNNVAFADVYYQTSWFDVSPEGRPIPGAYNRLLTETELLGGSLLGDHTDVWNRFYRESISSTSMSGYAFSPMMQSVVKNPPARPAPNFFATTSDGQSVQDHAHTSPALLRLQGDARTKMERVRWEPESPKPIFNGDFNFAGDLDFNQIPAWTWNEGAGGAKLVKVNADGTDLALRLGGSSPQGYSRTHSRFSIPSTATTLQFDYNTEGSSDDQIVFTIADQALPPVLLTTTVKDWKRGVSIPLPANLPKTGTLKIEQKPGADGKYTSVVTIDNLDLRAGNAGSTPTPGSTKPVIQAFNDGLRGVRQAGQLTRLASAGLNADIPIVQESVGDMVGAPEKLAAPFESDNELTDESTMEQIGNKLTALGFKNVSTAISPTTLDPAGNLLRATWNQDWATSTIPLGFGFKTGFDYFDDGTSGEFAGKASASISPINLNFTIGVDLVDGIPSFFVSEGSSLTINGVSITGSVSTNIGIRNLLDVDVKGDFKGQVSGKLTFTDPDSDEKLRIGQFGSAQSIVKSTLTGSLSFTPTFTATIPVIGDLDWGGTASVTITDGKLGKPSVVINPPSTATVEALLKGAYQQIASAFNLFDGSGLGETLPITNKSLGETLGLPSFLTSGGMGANGFSVNITPQTVLDLVNGRTVDLIRFEKSGGDEFKKSFDVPLASAAVPLGPIPLTVSLAFHTEVGFSYRWFVGMGIDTSGFYIDPRTSASATGRVAAGLTGDVSVAGIAGVKITAGIGAGVNVSVGIEDPDPRDGKIYLDELISQDGSLGEAFLDSLRANFSGEAFGFARAVAYIQVRLWRWSKTYEKEIYSDEFPLASFGDTLGGNNRAPSKNIQSIRNTSKRSPFQTNEMPDGLITLNANGQLLIDARQAGRKDEDNFVSVTDVGSGQVSVEWRGLGRKVFTPGQIKSIVFEGGEKDDSLFVGENITAPVTANGNGGNDLISVKSAKATLSGGSGSDILRGGSEGDEIKGGDGDDEIYGNAGDDTLLGDSGNDRIDGGTDKDTIRAGSGSDVLIGGSGTDSIYGESESDQIFGGTGLDNLSGGDGDDFLYGEAGADTLFGGQGNDTLIGGSENDLLKGEAGDDILYGDLGGVTPQPGETQGADELHGGDDNDKLFGEGGNDKIYGDDEGQKGSDLLSGDAGDDELYGRGGNDTIFGGLDKDKLWGGDGDDALNGGGGSDELNGEGGADILRLDFDSNDGTTDILRGGLDKDMISISGSYKEVDMVDQDTGKPLIDPVTKLPRKTLSDEVDDSIQVEQSRDNSQVFSSTFEVRSLDPKSGDLLKKFFFTFDTSENSDIESIGLEGLGGNDRLEMVTGPLAGRDMIFDGGTGNDTLIGGAGQDTLRGGDGDDVLFGNGGDDILYGEDGRDELDGGDGTNLLDAGSGGGTLKGGTGREVLRGGPNNDILIAGASFYGSIITGGPGDDTIIGGSGRDTLDGGEGNDTILGGDLGDTIIGGAGNDTLIGELGRDSISGNEGEDTIYTYLNNDIRARLELSPLPELDSQERQQRYDQLEKDLPVLNARNSELLLIPEEERTDDQQRELEAVQDALGIIKLAQIDLLEYQAVYIDIADGGPDNDLLYGSPFLDNLNGGSGDDQFFASSGRRTAGTRRGDSIRGEEGQDTLWFDGTEGPDKITFGTTLVGVNRYITVDLDGDGIPDGQLQESTTENIGVRSLGGDDKIIVNTGSLALAGIRIDGGAGNDIIDASGYQGVVMVSGGPGHDTITGGSNNDLLEGNEGDDTITGGPGNDKINGGDGNDRIFGNEGDDGIIKSLGYDTIDGGSGKNKSLTGIFSYLIETPFNPTDQSTLDDGSVVYCGIYSNYISFGSVFLKSASDSSIYIVKIEKNGSVKWAKSIECYGSGFSDRIRLSVLLDGSVCIQGDLKNYNNCSIVAGDLKIENRSNMPLVFLIKISNDGYFKWANKITYYGFPFGPDKIMNLYSFTDGSIIFSPETFSWSMSTDAKIAFGEFEFYINKVNPIDIVCKIDNEGNFSWVKKLQSYTIQQRPEPVINILPNDTLAMGFYFGRDAFSDDFTLISNYDHNIAMVLIDKNGKTLWSNQINNVGGVTFPRIINATGTKIIITADFYNDALIGTNLIKYRKQNALENLENYSNYIVACYSTDGNLSFAQGIWGDFGFREGKDILIESTSDGGYLLIANTITKFGLTNSDEIYQTKNNPFLSKINKYGFFEFIKKIPVDSELLTIGNSFHKNDTYFITGDFSYSLKIDNFNLYMSEISNSNEYKPYDNFIISLDVNGSILYVSQSGYEGESYVDSKFKQNDQINDIFLVGGGNKGSKFGDFELTNNSTFVTFLDDDLVNISNKTLKPNQNIWPPVLFGGRILTSPHGIAKIENQTIATNPLDGSYVVAWQESGATATGIDVYSQRFSAAGLAMGNRVRVNSTTTGTQSNPAIAMDANGKYVITWQDSGSNPGIFARIFSADGTPSAQIITVSTQNTNGEAQQPSIGMDQAGNFVIAWTYAGTKQVQARRFTALGIPIGPEFRVDTAGSEPSQVASGPSVAMDGSGNFAVIWQTGMGPGNGTGIFGRWYKANGSGAIKTTGERIAIRQVMNGTTPIPYTDPDISMNERGDSIVTWSSPTSGTIEARRFDSEGRFDGPLFQPQTPTGNQPRSGIDAEGNVTLIWKNGANYLFAWQDRWTNQISQTTTFASGDSPVAMGMNPDGDFIVAWPESVSGGYAIATDRFTNKAPKVLEVTTSPDNKSVIVAFSQPMATSGPGSVVEPANWKLKLPDGRFLVQKPKELFGEDKNNNGVLDPGEDTNGNRQLDTIYDPRATPEQFGTITFGFNQERKRYEAVLPINNVRQPDYLLAPGEYEMVARRAITDSAGRGIESAPVNAVRSMATLRSLRITSPKRIDMIGDRVAPVSIPFSRINQPPVLTTPTAVTIEENRTLVLAVSANDPNKDPLSYSISGTDAALFSIDPLKGTLNFLRSADFESPTDLGKNNIYNVTLFVSDGAQSASKDLAIRVTNSNETPTITGQNKITISEGITSVFTAAAVDPEKDNLKFALGGIDSSLFTINASTGTLSFRTAPLFSKPRDTGADNTYNGTIQVSDGAISTWKDFSVTITSAVDIAVKVNNQEIQSNNATPIDFGPVTPTTASAKKTFTITNSGSTNLEINGNPKVRISGAQASDFRLTAAPASPVSPGGTTTFEITFSPSAEGTRTATLTILSNDPDESNFNIVLQGVGSQKPVLTNPATATFTYGSAGNFQFTATGSPAPTFSVTSGSLPSGISLDSKTGTLTGKTNPGVYKFTIAASNTSSPAATQAFTLTVNQATLKITAEDKVKIYGAVMPALTLKIEGLVNGDTMASISGLAPATTATTKSAIGNYPITVTGTNPNYKITLVGGKLTVNKADLVITPNNFRKTPGTAYIFKGLEFTATAMALSTDRVDKVTLTSSGAAANAIKGKYDIIASNPTGIGLANYNITLDKGILAVAPINNAPTGTDRTITTNEDQSYQLKPTDFGFVDAIDKNQLLSVKLSTLPTKGTLKLGGVILTTQNNTKEVTFADIQAGSLLYTPAKDENGTKYASFTFQVRDDGGTSDGGKDQDPTPNTLVIDVNPVNDPPVGSNSTVNFAEDTEFKFTLANFPFTDPEKGALSKVKFTNLPLAAKGTLKLNGVIVQANQEILGTDISKGLLTFMPTKDGNGTSYDSLKFQVRDNGGILNGGVDLDPVSRTLTFNIVPVNDAPLLTVVNTMDGPKKNIPFEITYEALAALANEKDVDLDPISFRIQTVNSGNLEKFENNTWATAVPGKTLLAPKEKLRWTPKVAGSALKAFTIAAWDGALLSAIDVQVLINVAQ